MREALFAIALAIFPPCPTEDSSWCGWNAAENGNQRGRSFIALESTIIYGEIE